MADWPAMQKWQATQYLASKLQGQQVCMPGMEVQRQLPLQYLMAVNSVAIHLWTVGCACTALRCCAVARTQLCHICF